MVARPISSKQALLACPLSLSQIVQQFNDTLSRDGVDHPWSDFRQRSEHEQALSKSWMRDLQARFVLNAVAEQNQIKIERPRSPCIGTLASVCLFDGEETVEDLTCGERYVANRHRIQISRLVLQSFPFGFGVDEIGNRQVRNKSREAINCKPEGGFAVAEV